MNDFKLTMGIEFEDKYKEAKRKMLDFKKAFDELTVTEQKRLVEEAVAVAGFAISAEQLINFMKFGGQL